MGLTDKQRTQLNRAPAAAHVRTKERRGKEFAYLEGWRAIEIANRIFGPDGWDRETLEMRCAATKQIGPTLTAAYVAKVRITIHTEGRTIIRDGQGCGEGRGETPFEAHDMGLKAAETDATKRALSTLGRALGLGFGLGEGSNPVGTRRRPSAERLTEHGSPPADPLDNTDSGRHSGEPGADIEVSAHHTVAASLSSQHEGGAATPRNGSSIAGKASTGQLPQLGTSAIRVESSASAMLIPKERRIRNKEHLRYVASQPCLICDRKPADAHHLRFAQPTAMAKKVSDEFTVPLCRLHHRQVHCDPDERGWWKVHGIEPLEVAEDLWRTGT